MTGIECLPLLGERIAELDFARDAHERHSPSDYLADVRALSEILPPGKHVLNFCHDRYRFVVGFGASLLRQKISLLPSTRTPAVLRRIHENYPQTFCLHDGDGLGELCADSGIEERPAIALFAYPASLVRSEDGDSTTPLIPVNQVAAHVFTSGSTGTPVPHVKQWGSLVASARAQVRALELGTQSWSLIGTVPSQHMYGFESLILLALHGGASLWSGHPFYPADVDAAISAMPRPRMLVTAPAHLRALTDDGRHCPAVDRLLSATAMLTEPMCRQAEAAFGASVCEIYGSTETGQIASRRSSQTRHWRLFPGITVEQRGDGYWANGGHVLQATQLSDTLEILDGEHFELLGRNSDMINIAGKRGSLVFLNHALLAVPGVVDACMFVPEAAPRAGAEPSGFPDTTRLCAIVVAPQRSAAQVLRALRSQIDPVFLPRPIILVASLPRNATGKIPREVLLALLEQHRVDLRNELR